MTALDESCRPVVGGEWPHPLHHGRTIFTIPDIAPGGQLPAATIGWTRLTIDFRRSAAYDSNAPHAGYSGIN